MVLQVEIPAQEWSLEGKGLRFGFSDATWGDRILSGPGRVNSSSIGR